MRRFVLTLHVTASVGWLGAVIAYLVLVAAALKSQDDQIMRFAWLGMEAIGWYAIVPLSLVSLLSGLIQALGTSWGLLQHYWIVFKLLLTVFATLVLLLTMSEISALAGLAAMSSSSGATLPALDGQLLHPGVGLLVLLVVTGLSVFKPRGLTPYGQRQRKSEQART